MIKLAGMIVFFIWVRGTLLRLRIDQLTRLSWKFLVPIALLNLGNGAFWALTTEWTGPLVLARWGISAAIVIVPFVLLGRRLTAGQAPRTYRYAA
jgi:NADH-quinone oxidoreductase subunit H